MKKKLDDQRPIYLQIKQFVEDAILSGSIKSGERVPSTNELAKFYQINPATARQGVNELVSENILRKQRGVGMFVTEEAKSILIDDRTDQFYKTYIIPLREEARKLNITTEQLLKMIGTEDDEHAN